MCFGITGILLLDNRFSMILQLAGGLYLLYLGIKIIRNVSGESRPSIRADSLRKTYISLFLLTLANPMTWLTFAGGYAGLGLDVGASNAGLAVCFIAGVFLGSSCWWWLLSGVTARLSKRLNGPVLLQINRVSGSLIIIFGVWALVNGIG